MASIQKRTSKAGVDSWRVGYHEDRKLKWSPTFATAQGALEFKGLVERLGPEAALGVVRQRSGRDAHSGPPLLSEWLERHLAMVEAKATPGTVADYRRLAARTWLPSLGPLPIDAITEETVLSWVSRQRRTETSRSATKRARAAVQGLEAPPPEMYSAKSIRNAHGLLSTALSTAVRAGHLDRNVAHGLSLPSDDQSREMEIFTEAELVQFISAMDPHYQALVQTLAASGMRIGEATALQVRDVDLSTPAPVIHVRRAWKKGAAGTYLGSPKSKRGRRTIVLPGVLTDILAPLIKGKGAEDLVFTAAQGGQIHAHRFRERQWQAALERAKITKRLTPHSLRHTSASHALMDGVSPIVVQNRLGHESLDTTSRVYAHLLTGAQGAAAESAGRLIGGSAPQIES